MAYRELNRQNLVCEFDIPGFGAINNSAFINVEYKPYFETDEMEGEIEVVHGTKVILHCKVDANPIANFSWSFDNTKRLTTLPFIGDELLIDEVYEQHKGRYKCVAENKFGRVKRSFDVDLMPKGRPTFAATKGLFYANLSESVEFTCRVHNSMPLSELKWTLQESDAVHFESSTQLKEDIAEIRVRIDNVQRDEDFECIAENEFGRETRMFKLIVQSPAEIEFIEMFNDTDSEPSRMQNDDGNDVLVELAEGKSISFNCAVRGFPEPSIMWLLDGERIKFDSKLTLENVSKNEEGTYSCTAENSMGASSQNFTLMVLRPARILDNPATSLKVFENDEVLMDCDFDGSPYPEIVWIRHNEKIDESEASNSKFEVEENRLKFSATQADTGMYSCRVENEYGLDSKNFTLIVLGECVFLLEHI